ncbi:MAG: hydroxyphenylacetyl-CoA thioesterase PaaI [SAR324 cluster bacterium]|nr:hydroxyphenylacetyl-CoA thioesterase PaaI [SAR324 cluster bacterium]
MDRSQENQAEKIAQTMHGNDPFAAWLGIQLIEILPGKARVQMKVRSDMLNGHRTCHGGVTFSLADSAFGLACNTHGQISFALEANISYSVKVLENETLTACAEEVHRNHKIGVYEVTVSKEDGTKVAFFRGTAYRSKRDFFAEYLKSSS